MNKNLVLFPLIVLAFISCVNTGVFEKNTAIENAEWNSEKVLSFEYLSKDTLAVNNVYLNVRHAGNYAYSNLYLFVSTQAPNGKTQKDTLEFTLADTRGKWVGKGIGDIYELRMVYKLNIKFGQVGKYTFKVEQAMREPILKGIVDVGVRIE
jgi:gliding motility-associated lipoprotein GldH